MTQLAFDLSAPVEPVDAVVPAILEAFYGDELFALAPDWSGEHVIRQVSFFTAFQWVAKYHYLGGVPSTAKPYGWFGPDMKAVIVFGQPSNASGVAAKYGLEAFSGNIEIVRVAVHPDAEPNTASKCVAAACKAFCGDAGVEWVFSYADTGQGHHGGIYQALGAVYVGLSPAERGYLLNGDKIHPRTLVSKFGTRNPTEEQLRLARSELVRVADLNTAKHTYILPLGNAKTKRTIRKALEPHSLPYPKRAPEESEEIRPTSSGEGQVRSLVGA